MNSKTWVAAVLGLMICAGPAWAIKDPETKESFSDTATCFGKAAKAAAVGVREATFGIDVYAVVLYTETPGQSVVGTKGCVRIRARFVRDVGANKIRDAWLKGFKKHGVSADDAAVKSFLQIVSGEMKKKREMVIDIAGDKVVHSYMSKSVTVEKAEKLGVAIKKIYVGKGSPVPTLRKDLKKRGVAKP